MDARSLSRLGGALVALGALLLPGPLAAETPRFETPWPPAELAGERVAFPTTTPFALTDVGSGALEIRDAKATLFLPPEASAESPVPAVILLHGAGGVMHDRELTYGPQLAQQGVAALAIDSFGARRDLAQGFLQRLMAVTEVTLLADAFAGLAYLDSLPEVDGDRVALIGFSYGAMASVLAAYEQVSDRFLPEGPRFAAHVGYYGPCIVRLEDPATTGAPVLLLWGSGDQIVDAGRCAEVMEDLEQGGSDVRRIVYPGALHQWDGGRTTPWRAPRNLANCRYLVRPDGTAWDVGSAIPLVDPTLRQLSLAFCSSDDGYLIGRDDEVRAQSNQALGDFLGEALATGTGL